MPVRFGKRIALVIGEGGYSGAFPKLLNPPGDAEMIGKALESSAGFEVISRRDLNRGEMRDAIQAFAVKLKAAGSDAVGLFYFAGHGLQVAGRNYLIPLGASLANIQDGAVAADEVLEAMANAGARLNLVFLDACREGLSAPGASQGFARLEGPHGEVVRRRTPQEWQITFSTAQDDTAVDGSNGHSPFAIALHDQIRVPSQPYDRLLKGVANSVNYETRLKQPRPQQVYTSGFSLSEFEMTPGIDATGAPVRPGASAPTVAEVLTLVTSARADDSKAQVRLGQLYWDGADHDDGQAVAWWRKAAQKGEIGGEVGLSNAYQLGRGVPKDMAQSMAWLHKAANGGYAYAQENLAIAYLNGVGVRNDPTEALVWLRKAAEQGRALSQRLVGDAYHMGRGVAADPIQATGWYQRAADLGDAQSQSNLGSIFYTGDGVARDVLGSTAWFRKAAEQGNAYGEMALGIAYLNGTGVEQDNAQALIWLRQAADQNMLVAQRLVGDAYRSGHGAAADPKEAVHWYRLAADQGDAESQVMLGSIFYRAEGVAKDDAASTTWFRKAAEQDYPNGEISLGIAYLNGTGIGKDDGQGLIWLRKAAGHGMPLAQRLVGDAYRRGRGVTADPKEAARWYQKAADQGDQDAKRSLRELMGS